jgi:glycosyltransferase involved in cell wall biosynthesis
MRILLVTHNVHPGEGQARVNYELVRFLLARGHAVTLVAGEAAPDLVENAGFSHRPVSFRRWPTALLSGLVFSRRATRAIEPLAGDVDLVVACGAVCSYPADVNIVHFVHTSWLRSPYHDFRMVRRPRTAYRFLYTLINAQLETKAFAAARQVIAVSELVRQQLIDSGVEPEKIVVIENGVDIDMFTPSPRTIAAEGVNVSVALFVGDIRSRRKNLDTVLLALRQTSNVRLMVAGDARSSPFPAQVPDLIKAGRVQFLGYRSDVHKLMTEADFFVFPSRAESMALVFLEAMASGLPVISASSAGAAPLITPEAGIVLDDPNDVDGLAAAMQRLAGDPELRASMGREARRIAEEHTWERMAERYEALFKSTVEEKTERPAPAGNDGFWKKGRMLIRRFTPNRPTLRRWRRR